MKNKRHMFVLVLCLIFQAAFIGPASALNIGKFLGEVSGALDRVNATLDRAIGGVNTANQTVLDQSREKAPETSAFLGRWEKSWEVSMGQKTHESLREKPGFSKDRAMLNRVGTIARRLVPHVKRKDLNWTFAVLDTDEVNAFAAPGGYIYVTRGLMNLAGSDDEIAGVLAHEIGHADLKHSVRQAEKAGLMTALVIGLGLNKKTKDIAPYAAIAAYFTNLKFSRDDEYEADAYAVKNTHAAGYNPAGIIDFFNKINTNSKAPKIARYFSTHPPTPDRIKAVERQIARLPANSRGTSQATGSSSGTNAPGTYQQRPAAANSGIQSPQNPPVTARPTGNELKVAYEAYVYHQQVYQYKIQQQAPVSEVMDAFNKYQAAKKRYLDLRKAAGI